VVSFKPSPLYPRGNSPWFPLDRRLGLPQSRYGRYGEVKILNSTGTRTPTTWSPSTSHLFKPIRGVERNRALIPPRFSSGNSGALELLPDAACNVSRLSCGVRGQRRAAGLQSVRVEEYVAPRYHPPSSLCPILTHGLSNHGPSSLDNLSRLTITLLVIVIGVIFKTLWEVYGVIYPNP
jgi:hypothetical protein